MDMELIHDLRLSAQLIQSSAQMLAMTVKAPEAREYLEALMDGAAQLRRLLDGALAEGQAAGVAPVELVGFLRVLCLRCRDHAAQRGVGLRLACNVEALTLAADPDGLARVLLNLIMNALRFSPAGGEVIVRCTALGDFVEIAVADMGAGIAPERLPYVFLRGETDGGRGYGLPSAMDCARRLGGSISVQSSPGAGSTFTLRLPVRGVKAS